MDLVTDPARLWPLSKEREEENWAFRAFLKRGDRSPREIDRITHDLTRQIAGQIDCTRCANCCRVLSPILSEKDIRRLSRHLRISEADIRTRYLRVEKDREDDGWPFAVVPCPLLQESRCSIYPARPRVCRSYPNLLKRDVVFRLDRILSNGGVCPIVFNVVEALKRALGR